jgi:hypothetical protein
VTVTVDGNQLIPGDYYTEIYVQTNDYDETYDTIPVYVHVGPDPAIRVNPDAFLVEMFPGTTMDSIMWIVDEGDGTLAWEITVEDITPLSSSGWNEPLPDLSNMIKVNVSKPGAPTSGAGSADDPLVDKSSSAHLTRDAGEYTPYGSPLVGKGEDTLFVQLPHDPDESWSFGTSDAGVGYKMYENFWGLTEVITDVDYWGLCLIYDPVYGWLPGDPNNLVFDITFYSDPPDDPSLPPTEVVCTYTDVVPTTIVGTGQYYSGFEMYFFDGAEFDTPCDLVEGWVSIQSKSAGEGYDWLLWASAKTGDGFSYQENGTNPRYYDQAMILTGGGADWLVVSPESGQTSPHDSTAVDVTFDATDLEGGTWFANIIIDHNAPDKGQTIVPVRMSLLGANFAMTPDSFVVDMLEGEIVEEHLYISNPGGEGDLLYSMTDPMPWLSESPDAGAVPPDGEQDVVVTIDGTDLIAGDYYTHITITSNDFDHPETPCPVIVRVGPDPDIDVAPSYSAGVIPGCEYSVPMTISNLGEGHLAFNISIGDEPPVLGGSNNIRQALEDLKQAGQVNPNMDVSEAYRVVGAEKSSVPYTGGGSEGLMINFGGDKQAEILLVDDDGGLPGGTYTDIEYAYINALDDNGFVYDYYVVDWTDPLSDGPDLTTMQAYSMVIWFCGETWGYYGYDVLTANDESNLGSYLDGGGNLFLSAQDYLYASYPSAGSFSPGQFPYDYLHLSSVSQDALQDPYTVTGGVGSVAEGMQFDALRCYDNPDVPLWTDYLYPQAKGIPFFETGGNATAVQYDAGDFKTIFTTTEFCGLVDGSPNYRAELMAAVVEWMVGGGCPFTVTPESGIVDPESYMYLTLTFDGTAFTECAEDILTCYLAIASNDPDESLVGVEVSMWAGRGDVFDPACLIDGADVVFLINYVLKGGPAPDPMCMGDCNPPHDGLVDIEDVLYLIQYLYQGGVPPVATPETREPATILKQQQLQPQAPTPKPLERK